MPATASSRARKTRTTPPTSRRWSRRGSPPSARPKRPRLSAVDADFTLRFVDEWAAAWNAHDLDRILTHYADDVVFSSPHIVRRLGEPSGEVHGIDELRAYWGSGLEGESDLH